MGGVQYVLDTVIAALLANSNRKFSYGDMVSPFLKIAKHADKPCLSLKESIFLKVLTMSHGACVHRPSS